MTNESLGQHLKDQGLASEGPGQVSLTDCRLDFQVTGSSVLLVANKPAKASLLLAPESEYTNQADDIGVSQESKIGAADFDARYVIRDPDGKAGNVLTDDVIAAVEALEPFVELEMGKKRYRLLKKGLNEEQVLQVIRKLETLVGLTS